MNAALPLALRLLSLSALSLMLTACLPPPGSAYYGSAYGTPVATSGGAVVDEAPPSTVYSSAPAVGTTYPVSAVPSTVYVQNTRYYPVSRPYHYNRCGYDPCRCSSYRNHGWSGFFGFGSSSYYGSRYRSSSYYSNRYRGYSHRDNCYPSYHHSSSSSHKKSSLKHDPGHYRIAAGKVRATQTKPTGYHSPDWYRKRGYDLSKLTLKNESGRVYGSSKSSKSSSKKKKK